MIVLAVLKRIDKDRQLILPKGLSCRQGLIGKGFPLKFSIVTASFNSGKFIGEAIESALRQKPDVDDFEHIIAEAESSDNTPSVLARYPHLHIDRCKDHGIYDGMNRAISGATGDIIVILNADDLLVEGALLAAKKIFKKTNTKVLTGGFQVMDESGRIFPRTYQANKIPSFEALLFGIPAINARFFRRSAFDQAGLFDLKFGLAADRAWLLRARQLGLQFKSTSHCFYIYRQHENSSTLAGDLKTRRQIHNHHLSFAKKLAPTAPDELSRALAAFQSVEELKLAVLNGGRRQKTTSSCESQSALEILTSFVSNPKPLTRGIYGWWRWRNRHSDS